MWQPEGWLRVVTSDAQVVGIVTWVGLLVTIAGFWIAIAQLRKVKSSSMAAAEAVSNLVKVVRSQEQSAKINSALAHLTSAQAMMKQRNSEATAAHLTNGWMALVAAREMTTNNLDRDLIGSLVLSTRQLLDDINAPAKKWSTSDELMARRHAAISGTISDLVVFSARLNVALLGIGLPS